MLIRCDYLWEKNDPDLYAVLHCMQLLMNMMQSDRLCDAIYRMQAALPKDFYTIFGGTFTGIYNFDMRKKISLLYIIYDTMA